eukprot:TRINITY_DN935_c12_g1_i1.p1 TRINITY_DN935_c12_g1~~TRINITY_DN935_c12_g1_i1.p1  ORF type:complete len:839 (+),score=114.18 TRINITY_DN935_c12_g1_i1:271-2787(+)
MTNGSDVSLQCEDEDTHNRVAMDDDVVIRVFATRDGTCSGTPVSTIHHNASMQCGSPRLSPISLHCTKCEWVFFEASAAPYFLQAFGVLAFLFFCVIFNICCQRRIDRWSKVFPPKVLPCCFASSESVSDYLLVELVPKFEDTSSRKTSQSFMLPRSLTDDTFAADKKSGCSGGGILNLSMSTRYQVQTPSVIHSDVHFGSKLTDGSCSGKDKSPIFKPPKGMNRTRTAPELRRPKHLSSSKPRNSVNAEDFLELLNNPDTPDKVQSPIPDSPEGIRKKTRRQASLSPIDECGSTISAAPSSIGRKSMSRRHRSVSDVLDLHDLQIAESPPVRKNRRRHRPEQVGLSPRSHRSDSSELVEMYQFHAAPEPEISSADVVVELTTMTPSSISDDDVVDDYFQHSTVYSVGCPTCGCEINQHDCTEWIQMGASGEFGCFGVVKATDYENSTEEAVKVVFLKPDMWLPNQPAEGCSSIWSKLSEHFGSIILEQTTEEYQIELNANVTVNLPKQDVKWISNNGCQFVRLRDDAKNVVPADEWSNWYTDFLLCIGRVIKATKSDTHGECYLCVSFFNSATITLPQSAFDPATEEEHASEYLIIPQLLEKRIMMAVFVASTPPLLSAKALFLVSVFVHAIYVTSQDGHQGRAANHSLWEAYEEVYFKLFNSGYPTLMADCTTLGLYFIINFKPTLKGFIRGVGVPSFIVLVVTSFISLPGILTHALPMAAYYGWIWVPLLLIVYFVSKLIISVRPSPPVMNPEDAFSLSRIWKNHRAYVVKACIYFLIFRFCIEIIGVVFLQTNYNYGVLIYDGGAYLDVIKTEYENREFLCVWERGMQAASFLI